MKAFQNLDLSALIDMLSGFTDEYIKMQVLGNRSKDFYICKGKIERLQLEIELRKSVEREDFLNRTRENSNSLIRTINNRRGK